MDMQAFIPAPLNIPEHQTANTRLHQAFAEDRALEAREAERIRAELQIANKRLKRLVRTLGDAGNAIAQAIKTEIGDVIRTQGVAVGMPAVLTDEQRIVLRAINRVEDICND